MTSTSMASVTNNGVTSNIPVAEIAPAPNAAPVANAAPAPNAAPVVQNATAPAPFDPSSPGGSPDNSISLSDYLNQNPNAAGSMTLKQDSDGNWYTNQGVNQVYIDSNPNGTIAAAGLNAQQRNTLANNSGTNGASFDGGGQAGPVPVNLAMGAPLAVARRATAPTYIKKLPVRLPTWTTARTLDISTAGLRACRANVRARRR